MKVEKYEIKKLSHMGRKKYKTHLNNIIDFLMIEPLSVRELSDKLGLSKGYVGDMINYLKYDGKIINKGWKYELI